MRLALALLALLLAPLAQAAPVVSVAPFPFPLAPLREDARTLVTVEAPCGEDVHLAAENAPEWARVAIDPPVLTSPACAGTWSDSASLAVLIAAAAPALAEATIRVVARSGNATGAAELPVVVDFHNVLDVHANETSRTVEPQRAAVFLVAVTNHGNGNAKVTMRATQPPRGLMVVDRVPIVLEPGRTVTVPITAQSPYRNGQMDETESFSVTFSSAYALDPTRKGDEESITFTVRTQGFYVPGVAPLAGLCGLALVALLRRRT